MKQNSNTTKQTLINTTIELYSSKGIKSISIRDIAKHSGTNVQTIFYHFGNKEGLLVAVLQYLFEKLFEEFKASSESGLDPLESFKSLIRTHLLVVINRRKENSVFFHFMDDEGFSEPAASLNKEFQRKVLDLYRNEIRSLKSSGYLRDRSSTIVAFNTIAIVNWFAKWYKADGPVSLEEAIEQILQHVLFGIQSAPTASNTQNGNDQKVVSTSQKDKGQT